MNRTLKGKTIMKIKSSQILKPLAFGTVLLLGLLTAVYAGGQKPITGSATKITGNAAVLTGTFSPNATFASMGWGLASDKGYSANCGPLATKPKTQSCRASGLTCNTKYAYIATQETKNNSSIGARKYFTTAACK